VVEKHSLLAKQLFKAKHVVGHDENLRLDTKGKGGV
jgi:hypothetical protein